MTANGQTIPSRLNLLYSRSLQHQQVLEKKNVSRKATPMSIETQLEFLVKALKDKLNEPAFSDSEDRLLATFIINYVDSITKNNIDFIDIVFERMEMTGYTFSVMLFQQNDHIEFQKCINDILGDHEFTKGYQKGGSHLTEKLQRLVMFMGFKKNSVYPLRQNPYVQTQQEIPGIRQAWSENVKSTMPKLPEETEVEKAQIDLNKALVDLFTQVDELEKVKAQHETYLDQNTVVRFLNRKHILKNQKEIEVRDKTQRTTETKYIQFLTTYEECKAKLALLKDKQKKEQPFFNQLRTLPYDVLQLVLENLLEDRIKKVVNSNDNYYLYVNKKSGNTYIMLSIADATKPSIPDLRNFGPYGQLALQNALASVEIPDQIKKEHQSFTDFGALIRQSDATQDELLGDFDFNNFVSFVNETFPMSLESLVYISTTPLLKALFQSIHNQVDFIEKNPSVSIILSIQQNNTVFELDIYKNEKKWIANCSSSQHFKTTNETNRREDDFYKQKVLGSSDIIKVKQTFCRYFFLNMFRCYILDNFNQHFVADISDIRIFISRARSGGSHSILNMLYKKYIKH